MPRIATAPAKWQKQVQYLDFLPGHEVVFTAEQTEADNYYAFAVDSFWENRRHIYPCNFDIERAKAQTAVVAGSEQFVTDVASDIWGPGTPEADKWLLKAEWLITPLVGQPGYRVQLTTWGFTCNLENVPRTLQSVKLPLFQTDAAGNQSASTPTEGASNLMPWLSIFMAILSFLTSLKKNPEKKGAAVAAGALAGLGTYYVTHETEWGRDNLGSLDGVVATAPAGATPTTLPDGSKLPAISTYVPSTTNGTTPGLWQTVSNLGPAGVATTLGAVGVATGAINLEKLMPWALIGLAVSLVLR